MPEFRIYYDEDKTYDGDPFNAPVFGVLAIVQKHPAHGREIVQGGDYFVLDGDRWRSVDFIGMIDYLQYPGAKRVLIGRMVEREYFYSVAKRANEDPDFPPRTAWGNKELKL
jgi:hypothetical protein